MNTFERVMPSAQRVRHRSPSSVRAFDWRLWLPAMTVTLAIQCIVLRSYWSGAATPPWDFYGPYTSEAFAWWHDGGFFDPAQWMPYSWGGYPAPLAVQDSSWYLPLGVASLFTELTPHIFAVIQALEISAGGLGALVLCRAFGLRRGACLFALAAYSFAPGLFSNAQHIDIVRGFAFAPWLLLLLSPRWPWRRWWAWPAAVLFLWQYALSVYPGILATSVYVGIVWLVVLMWRERERARYLLLRIASAAVVALLLCGVKYVAVAGLGRTYNVLPDTSVFSRSLLSTIFYGYGGIIPNDLSMRPFFVVAPVAVLLPLYRVRGDLARGGLATFVTALLLGLPFWPWWSTVNSLPGLSESRFTMNDFKVFLILGAVVCSACALSALLGDETHNRGRATAVIRRLAVGGVLLGALVLGLRRPSGQAWFPAFVLLVVSGCVVLLGNSFATRRIQRSRTLRAGIVGTLVTLAVASGATWAYGTAAPWKASGLEKQLWGANVSTLIASREGTSHLQQRPPRELGQLNLALRDITAAKAGEAAYYDGRPVVVAYTNLKGVRTFDEMLDLLARTGAEGAFADFLTAPGIAYGSVDGRLPTAAAVGACVTSHECGTIGALRAVSYEPGQLVYQLTTAAPSTVLFNEAYYPGWSASACGKGGCRSLSVSRGPGSVLQVELPSGKWRVDLSYEAPFWTLAVVITLAGSLLFLVGIIVAACRFLRDRRRTVAMREAGSPSS